MKYTKPPLSHEDQINLLKNRGLIIPDKDRAYRYLENVGYFRLTGYMYHLQANDGSHHFKEGISFNDIILHYEFDKNLRVLVMEYLERIEVSLRAKLTDVYSTVHGFFWYNNQDLFADSSTFETINDEIRGNFGTHRTSS